MMGLEQCALKLTAYNIILASNERVMDSQEPTASTMNTLDSPTWSRGPFVEPNVCQMSINSNTSERDK